MDCDDLIMHVYCYHILLFSDFKLCFEVLVYRSQLLTIETSSKSFVKVEITLKLVIKVAIIPIYIIPHVLKAGLKM